MPWSRARSTSRAMRSRPLSCWPPLPKSRLRTLLIAMDLMAINSVRNLLFGNGGQQDNGLDLMARDVERARDHGIGTYNQVRVAYGLPPLTRFAQITSNVAV